MFSRGPIICKQCIGESMLFISIILHLDLNSTLHGKKKSYFPFFCFQHLLKVDLLLSSKATT